MMNCGTNPTSQVACSKARRVNCNPKCVMKLPFSNQAEAFNSKAEAEALLNLILKKDGTAAMRSALSSPPFFNGSPRNRAMNHDVCFLQIMESN